MCRDSYRVLRAGFGRAFPRIGYQVTWAAGSTASLSDDSLTPLARRRPSLEPFFLRMPVHWPDEPTGLPAGGRDLIKRSWMPTRFRLRGV